MSEIWTGTKKQKADLRQKFGGPCNLHKGGYGLEEWRALLARAASILARDKSLFRAAQRFGVVTVTNAPVTFYFERISHD